MNVNQKWVTQMKNSISGGIMLPQTDPFDVSVFYVSDGTFSTYSGMRFRKLSIETGEELANALTKDGTRCIYSGKEYIYAFLSKHIQKNTRNVSGGNPAEYIFFVEEFTIPRLQLFQLIIKY